MSRKIVQNASAKNYFGGFGKRLKLVRTKNGLKQTEFAQALHVTSTYISKLELEKASPSDRLIMSVCLIWHINETWLRTGEGRMESPHDVVAEKLKDIPGEDNRDLRTTYMSSIIKGQQAREMEEIFLPGFHSLAHVTELLRSEDAENLRYLLNAILREWEERDMRDRMLFELSLENCIPNYRDRKKEMATHFAENINRVRSRTHAADAYIISNAHSVDAALPPRSLMLPVAGRAAAGSPIEMVETTDEAISINGDVHALPGDFIVVAVGDSMIDVGISDGAYCIIRPQPQVETGEIALVAVDNGSTIKRFYRDADGYRLVPCNPTHPVQHYGPDTPIRILGRFVGVANQAIEKA